MRHLLHIGWIVLWAALAAVLMLALNVHNPLVPVLVGIACGLLAFVTWRYVEDTGTC